MLTLLLSVIATVAALLLLIPVARRLGTRQRPGVQGLTEFSPGPIALHGYQDRDGAATVESEAEFHDLLPRRIFYVAAVVGAANAVALAVLATLNGNCAVQWVIFGAWVCVSQTFCASSNLTR
jgi:hypothetical protein